MELKDNRRKHRVLVSGNSVIAKKQEAKADRTTLMLVILLVVFLCTELPQGNILFEYSIPFWASKIDNNL